jgi:serine/threonine-protein kinase
MSRHWRCANAHDWTGDLGALTYCPECGSADVYEVRPPLPADRPLAPAAALAPSAVAGAMPPPPPSGDSILDQTWVQEAPAALTASGAPDDTLVQAPAPAPSRVANGAGASTPEIALRLEFPSAPPEADSAVLSFDPAGADDSFHDQITRELPRVTAPGPADGSPPDSGESVGAPSGRPAGEDGGSATWLEAASLPGHTDFWSSTPSPSATALTPPAGPAADAGGSTDATPRRPAAPARGAPHVPGYEILGVLGRGGMGVVYKARQQGLNRLVALKMILGGVHADAAGLGRFRTEAEAIAALQHPNIVQVYEVGEHDGLPFFSLEYLDGGSLARRLAGRPLPPREAAALAEQLARAVQYAHEHGVVHRDLKPGNILFAPVARGPSSVAENNPPSAADHGPRTTDNGQPKITDFGLARRLDAASDLTGTGAVLGTPSYMAPEQAEGRTHAAGPPADIHALGAILYEMLTGRPPFLGADPTATVLQVRLLEPVPPRRWQPGVPRDLETVTLKCLQKEPHRRYASAAALADDLRRFLDDQPVLARPVPAWERAWKWAKRDPSAAGLAVLSAIVALGLAVGGLAFARYEHRRAEELDKARQTAIDERRRAESEFRRAEQNFFRARDAVKGLLTRVGGERLRQVPHMEPLRRELLTDALGFYGQFLRESDDPAVRQEAGWAYQQVGQIRELLGPPAGAIAAYQKAAELFERLVRENPTDPGRRLDLADTHRLLAIVLGADGQFAEADRSHAAARDLLTRLVADFPGRPEYRRRLGELLHNRGMQLVQRRQPAKAEEQFRAALAEFDRLCADDPTPEHRIERALVQSSFGGVLLAGRQTGAALEQLRAAADGLADLARDQPEQFDYAKEMGRAYNNLGAALLSAGRAAEAETAFAAAADRFTKLAGQFPRILEYRYALALALDNLAHLQKTRSGLKAAEPVRDRARQLWAELVAEVDTNTDYKFRYALSLDEYGIFLEETGRRAEALQAVREALDRLRKLAADDPADPALARELARRHLNLGILLARDRQDDEADVHYSRAGALLEDVLFRSPADDTARLDLITAYTNRATLMRHLGRPREEEGGWRRLAELQKQRAADYPANPDLAADPARTQFTLAELRGDRPADALAALREAFDRQRAALALAPRRADLTADLGKYGSALAAALLDQGDHAAVARTATQMAAKLPPAWSGWPHVAGLLCRCMRLAREDEKLAADARARAAKGYGQQALGLLRGAVAAGFHDAAALTAADDLEPLRTEAAFREEFAKLVADIEARSKGG